LDTFGKPRGQQVSRIKATYPVTVLTAEGSFAGETKSISMREAFVRCREPLRLNDLASLSIEVSADESLSAEAEVVWSNIYGPDDEITPRGMIVRFTNLSPTNRRRLHEVIASHYQRKLAAKAESS
jgi:hypothetical protein